MTSKKYRNTNKRHDGLVLDLEERIKATGWTTNKFVEYKQGEIDLYAVKGDYRAIFEMKCSMKLKNYHYAHNQMARAIDEYFHDNKRTFCFYVYYNNRKTKEYTINLVDPYNPKMYL